MTDYEAMQRDYLEAAKADNAASGHAAQCGLGFGEAECTCDGAPKQESCRDPKGCDEEQRCLCNMPAWF